MKKHRKIRRPRPAMNARSVADAVKQDRPSGFEFGDSAAMLLVGDCVEKMKAMPAGSVQCCVTSPPYWGLRDYGIPPRKWSDETECAFGLEPSIGEFVDHAVEVFREVRRVLRDDGTLWLNLGDSYAATRTEQVPSTKGGHKHGPGAAAGGRKSAVPVGLKAGDICNVPNRVAVALQADGWYWRSTIIWAKRSPMPESISGWRWRQCRVKVGVNGTPVQHVPSGWDRREQSHDVIAAGRYDGNQRLTEWADCPGCEKCEPNGGLVLRQGKWRPTTAHEYLFLFSKSELYFCDGDAVAEMCGANTHSSGSNSRSKAGVEGVERNNTSFNAATYGDVETRNPRSVWTFSSEPYKGAHFATFPTALPRRCIEAGTSSAGCCASCGSCLAPIVETVRVPTRPAIHNKIWKHMGADALTQRNSTSPNLDPQRHIAITRITGYRPTCNCAAEIAPCVVLDPFGGSGTTAQVATQIGRRAVICEINPEYADLARQRILVPLDKDELVRQKRAESAWSPGQMALFPDGEANDR